MTLDKHAPIKKKMVRGDEVSLMTKDLRKTIMNRPKIKYRYTKWPSRENLLAFNK